MFEKFPILQGSYLTYNQYFALYAITFAIALATIFYLFSCLFAKLSIYYWVETRKAKVALEENPSNNDGIHLIEPSTTNSSTNPTDIIDFNQTDRQNRVRWLMIADVVFSWLSTICLTVPFIALSSFTIITLSLCIIWVFLILMIRFVLEVISDAPLSSKYLDYDQPYFRRHLRRFFRMIENSLSSNITKYLLLFTGILAFSIVIPFFTWKICISLHSDGDGIPFMNHSVSSYFSRLLTVTKPCPDGPPCHIYTTLAENGSTSLFVTLHTSTNVQSLTISYDELFHYNQTQALRKIMTSTSFFLAALEAKGQRNVHSLLLYNLSANTMYFAQVHYHDKIQANFTFKTLSNATDPSKLNIITGGDIGFSQVSRRMTSVASSLKPDLLLIGGDFAYDNGLMSCYYCFDQTLWDFEKSVFTPTGYIIPMVLTTGNHEIGMNCISGTNVTIDESGPLFFSFFPQHSSTDSRGNLVFEVPAVKQRKSYHYHTFGKVLLISLDTGYITSYGGEQLSWMHGVLKNESFAGYSRWAIYHYPIYSPTFTPEELSSENIGDPEAYEDMLYWVPFFDTYQFNVAFENHRHVYKATLPLRNGKVDPNGTLYFGEGQWGVNRRVSEFDNSTGYFTMYGYANNIWQVVVDRQNSTISYISYGQNGSVLSGAYKQHFDFNF